MDPTQSSAQPSAGFVHRSVSRRSVLKGLASIMGLGAIAPLAAACGSQQGTQVKPAGESAKPDTSAPGQPAGAGAGAAKPAAGEPKKGGTLKIAIIGEAPALDPTFTTATITQNISWHFF